MNARDKKSNSPSSNSCPPPNPFAFEPLSLKLPFSNPPNGVKHPARPAMLPIPPSVKNRAALHPDQPVDRPKADARGRSIHQANAPVAAGVVARPWPPDLGRFPSRFLLRSTYSVIA